MTRFNDHFSVARGYDRCRPAYPGELFAWLAGAAPGRRLAWDCGTGSGQAARGLGAHFERVLATDPSLLQLSRSGAAAPGLTFAGGLAERAPLAGATIDLVTVAQALHWFDLDAFYAEVRRVARPGGLVAAWTYSLFRASAAVDRVLDRLHDVTLGAFWPPERRWVNDRYAGLAFPFARRSTPPFEMSARWDLDQVMGYLGTWSAVNRYRRATGSNPLPAVRRRLAGPWGRARRTVRFPLTVRVGEAAG